MSAICSKASRLRHTRVIWCNVCRCLSRSPIRKFLLPGESSFFNLPAPINALHCLLSTREGMLNKNVKIACCSRYKSVLEFCIAPRPVHELGNMSTSKSLSNSTLSLRFMQNAQRARQQAAADAERAKVKDEAEWEVSREIREVWGLAASSKATNRCVIRYIILDIAHTKHTLLKANNRPGNVLFAVFIPFAPEWWFTIK